MKKPGIILTFLFLVVLLSAAGITTSEAERVNELRIPASVDEIRAETFANCEAAEILTIYGTDTVIADGALEGSGIHTLRCCRAATQLIEYAEENGLAWEPLDPLDLVVTVCISENVVEPTQNAVAAFLSLHPEYAGAQISVIGSSETDLQDILLYGGKPDIFGMVQDQLYSINNLGVLDPIPASDAEIIRSRNVSGSVSAAQINGKLFAYPMTADNGFFLFYDKSVITDPSSMESILRDCEAADRKFYMEIDSGWYQIAFFFGAGCELEFITSENGTFESVNVSYANANGVKAMKSLISLIGSPAFENGSSVDSASNWAAIVSGTWDAGSAREYLGSNYAAAKLPVIDGYQMKSFGGFKMLGVMPQENEEKSALCHALANWLTDKQAQLDRYYAAGWGPSNLTAQQNEALQGDVALTALADQAAYAVPQGQIPGGYWTLANELVAEILSGTMNSASDEQILERLQIFENDIRGLLAP